MVRAFSKARQALWIREEGLCKLNHMDHRLPAYHALDSDGSTSSMQRATRRNFQLHQHTMYICILRLLGTSLCSYDSSHTTPKSTRIHCTSVLNRRLGCRLCSIAVLPVWLSELSVEPCHSLQDPDLSPARVQQVTVEKEASQPNQAQPSRVRRGSQPRMITMRYDQDAVGDEDEESDLYSLLVEEHKG